ncbi:MAG: TAXI family TRAP transporter solute-binding subunit [Rubinisphaera brasiliensis]|uniref:TAXI family TRAP transporter solute-binding subunit n=1 Tax=Rubinisphaera brasiliensis TaxID=119 RepID=UPI000C4CD3CD|nr:C4-dicarboxylate ABC transporter substrate-binding protein [Planctomyces sp.]
MSASQSADSSEDTLPEGHTNKPSLFREFEESRRLIMKTWGPMALAVAFAFFVAWFFVEPAPPDHMKIAAGPRDGAYFRYATEYAEVFARNGYELEVIETAGSIENYRLLTKENDVHLAIVQGGTKPETLSDAEFEAIASLYYEPLWIFVRDDQEMTRLKDLSGKTVAIGPPDSGTHAIARKLLQANGLIETVPSDSEADGTVELDGAVKLSDAGGYAAIQQLRDAEIDAACLVLPAGHSLIDELLSTPDVSLLQFDRMEAYRRLYPFLSSVTLYEGVVDLERNLPGSDTKLLAPVANMICTSELHDAFVPLLIKAAQSSHQKAGIFASKNKFPSLEFAEYKPHPAALDFFQYGPSFLNRYLPFWLASFINRMKIMMLPLITLAFPLIKMAPPIYRWQIRARIYRWYDLLRELDQQRDDRSVERIQKDLAEIQTMQNELKEVKVPLSYMEEFYNLHMHIELVKRRLSRRLDESNDEADADSLPDGGKD